MYYKELLLAGLLATAVPLSWADQAPQAPDAQESAAQEGAAEGEYMSEEQFLDSLNFRSGKVVLGGNLATLNLPDNMVFLDGDDAERVLVQAWGNPPDEKPPLGMILPKGVSPLAEESWAVTVEYEESGYVSDEDAADIDYNDMLKDLQQSAEEDNKWRAENGYEPVSIVGWASAPHYDAEGKKLHWAKEVQFGDSDEHTLNYNIRVLGRKGVLVLNFIAGMHQLPQIEQNVPAVLAMTDFNDGNRYADFNPDLDKVAAYGLGALIAGKAAAKVGLFAAALVLLKKLWILPVLLIGWIWRRITGKKSEAQSAPVEPQEQQQAPAEPARNEVPPPASSVMDLNNAPDDKHK
ncbi:MULTISPECIES: DUF2167 domain-containing protein [Pseudomonas]|uniref:DUF2167 domain-containing protein n=1 Tax=Pseudomonas fulva (strain 12-X) TaxID=743720 RepID=F6AJP8_PSEF1|nr:MULTISPECIES: DUF2167 domain-containing protein [Pseudomonas]AEF22917.1 Protein of unknown function DUF2167, membrane [Pseudomonas fulva 12-X]MBV7564314.1 DUF2167 domain-containing protein [Pseudomonas sp. sia0905]PZW69766.1 putative membrane-anchored protein [Pseudomonas sp. URMO17WK12:I1]